MNEEETTVAEDFLNLPPEVSEFMFSEEFRDIITEIEDLLIKKDVIDQIKAFIYLSVINPETDLDNLIDLIQKLNESEEIKSKILTLIQTRVFYEIKSLVQIHQEISSENTSKETLAIPNTAPAPTNLWQNKMQNNTGISPTQTDTNIKTAPTTRPIGLDPYKEIPN